MKLHPTSIILLFVIFATVIVGFFLIKNTFSKKYGRSVNRLETQHNVEYGDISVERYYRDGKTIKALGFYQNGNKKSEYYVTDSSGMAYQLILYYPNGQRRSYREQWLENNAVQYYEEQYYEDSILKKKEGSKVHQWEYYDEYGKPTLYIINDSLLTTEIMFHPNGNKRYKVEYVDGKLNGLWMKWDENGNLLSQDLYKDGHKVN